MKIPTSYIVKSGDNYYFRVVQKYVKKWSNVFHKKKEAKLLEISGVIIKRHIETDS